MRAKGTFWQIALVIAVLCGSGTAQQSKPSTPATNQASRPEAGESEVVAALRKRAEAAEGGDRAKLFSELAKMEIEEANSKFSAGDADQAQAEVARATADAQQAKQSALSTHKRLKQTQMALHELSRRLDGIEHSLSAEDRPQVNNAVERLQGMATELLEAMFKRK